MQLGVIVIGNICPTILSVQLGLWTLHVQQFVASNARTFWSLPSAAQQISANKR